MKYDDKTSKMTFLLRIDCWFFSFPWGMNENIDVHIVWRAKPPYENVHVGFFIHTSRKRKKKQKKKKKKKQLSILII